MPTPFEFRIEPVAYRIIDRSTVSLDRAIVASGEERIAFFRKRIRARGAPPAGRDDLPSLVRGHERRDHWTYWRREVDVYASDFCMHLSNDLRAPHGHAIEDEGETETLWLQNLAGLPARRWDVARFGRAMRALGEFQGRCSAEALPSHEWLSRGAPRAELTRLPALDEDAATVDRLERVLQTVCHFDLWANTGIGPFGYDVANTVFDSVWIMPGYAIPDARSTKRPSCGPTPTCPHGACSSTAARPSLRPSVGTPTQGRPRSDHHDVAAANVARRSMNDE